MDNFKSTSKQSGAVSIRRDEGTYNRANLTREQGRADK
jgi:hypothetical protein